MIHNGKEYGLKADGDYMHVINITDDHTISTLFIGEIPAEPESNYIKPDGE